MATLLENGLPVSRVMEAIERPLVIKLDGDQGYPKEVKD